MKFTESVLHHKRPDSIRLNVVLPKHQSFTPSPLDWRDEYIYFLLVDRFSDGQEHTRPLLDRANLAQARPDLPNPNVPNGPSFRFDRWAQSGADRWQGGTIKGVLSKLDYLRRLGVTAVWLSPVFKQRGHLDTFHGYGIQDFLDVDPRFGSRDDLVELVAKAHQARLRVILDIIFNHSGHNWDYRDGQVTPPFRPFGQPPYDFGNFLDARGASASGPFGPNDAVWPKELQSPDDYTRAGSGNLGAGDINDPNAEHKRTDFGDLRDFQLDNPGTLTDLAACYKYWIALTDCDGLRIDTLKHVSFEQARNFCGSIKEFAANIGKVKFFLVAEAAGGSAVQDRFLDVLGRNLDAALDIGEARPTLTAVAKGLAHPNAYFGGFEAIDPGFGSHRNLGDQHVSILDDHDHVFGQKLRFSSEASTDHQVVAGTAMQAFSLGIPCIYYGTEQAFSGPEPSVRQFLPEWGKSDRYLREAMFGPLHPRKKGVDGLPSSPDSFDRDLPGFGPFGTAGHHCFDENHPTFRRCVAILTLRQGFPVLRHGRQYLRPISFLGKPFAVYGPGEICAWSRMLDDEEVVCVVNTHGNDTRGADVLVDANLNKPDTSGRLPVMRVILNSTQASDPQRFTGSHPTGSTLPVRRTSDGTAFVEIRDLPPSEVLVLANHPTAEEGFATD